MRTKAQVALVICAGVRTISSMITDTIAYRVQDEAPVVGQTLDRSYVWDGDEPTEERLQGTCAFETEAQARSYGSAGSGLYLVEIIGDRVMAGALVGEVIIRDAVVLRVICKL